MKKSTIKIGYLTTSLSASPKAGGVERYSKSLVKSVSKLADVKALTHIGDNLNVLPKPSFKPLAQLKVFYQCLKHFKRCDIIHSLIERYSIGAALACTLLNAHLVVTLHGTYAIPPKGKSIKETIKRIMMKYMYGKVSIATTGSLFTEKKVREIVNFGECRFIPNGVDDKMFYKIPDSIDKNYLLTVGALKPRKGADIVIKALGLLKDKLPDLHYKTVSNLTDKSFYRQLKSLAKELGVEQRIDFLGRISNDELVKLYNECSIFVLAARDIEGAFEGFPMVFYEAMACGAPVISTKGFGSEYAIENGVNGYVIEPDNPEELASIVLKILSDKNLHNKLKQGALQEAQKHTWDKIALQLINLYKDALKI